eukprot:m.1129637 g.1129637  ORF g.1129637 m.1129637 type:complete len:96 (-) comp24420_c0_seq14:2-289(-)
MLTSNMAALKKSDAPDEARPTPHSSGVLPSVSLGSIHPGIRRMQSVSSTGKSTEMSLAASDTSRVAGGTEYFRGILLQSIRPHTPHQYPTSSPAR